jgi:hypothetical protein
MQRSAISFHSEEPREFPEPPPSALSLASLAVVLVSILAPALILFLNDVDGPTSGPTIGLILLSAGVVLPLAGLGALTEVYVARKRWIADLRFHAFRLARSRGESSVPSLLSIEEALFKAGAYEDALAVTDLREMFEPPEPPDDESEASGPKVPAPGS